jgi:DNA-binding CsgD family transcriptional regulator
MVTVKPVFKKISQVALAIKDEGGSELSLSETIYCHSEELIKLFSDQSYSQPCEPVLTFDIEENDHRLSLLLRPIEHHDNLPALLVCLESQNPLESIAKGLAQLGLSQREQEVAYLLCEGLKNTDISRRLYISRYTVENHIKSIFGKLGIHNRASLIRRVMAFA